MTNTHRLASGLRVLFVVVAALALSSCAPEAPRPVASTPIASSSSPTPSPTPTALPAVFTLPTTCAGQLPASRLATFSANKLVLLGGPDGRYGNHYLADATPEQQAGGITCIWGFSDTEISSITVSVAPITPANRATVVADLESQGLNQDTVDGANLFWKLGDETTQPAILNVLRNDSWISVIATVGGQASYDEATTIADEARSVVYVVSN